MKMENFFKILFLSIKISEANFIRFVEDHLQRLINNNPGGRYTPLITLVTTLLGNLMTAISQRSLNQALQEARTKTVDQFISDFKYMMSRFHFSITEKWKEGTDIYEEFFPRGLEEYTSCTKGNIVILMGRFIDVCDIHREDLPEGFVEPLATLKASYELSRTNQLGKIASTDGNRVDVAEKRLAVAIQLSKNAHTLALDFIGQTAMAGVYFDQSIITRPAYQNGEVPEPDILAEAVAPLTRSIILHGGFDANTLFHIVNTGSVILKFYTANMADDVVPSNALELAPGEEDDVTAAELGADGNLFLMVYNANAAIAGSYAVNIETE